MWIAAIVPIVLPLKTLCLYNCNHSPLLQSVTIAVATMKQFAFFGVLFFMLAVALVSVERNLSLTPAYYSWILTCGTHRRPFTCRKCRNRLLVAVRYWPPRASSCSAPQDNRVASSMDRVHLHPVDKDRADKARVDRVADRTKNFAETGKKTMKGREEFVENLRWNFEILL